MAAGQNIFPQAVFPISMTFLGKSEKQGIEFLNH